MAKKKILHNNRSYWLIGVGLFLIAISTTWKFYQRGTLSFRGKYSVQNYESSFSLPVKINISSQNISLNISETEIVNGIWGVSETGASHLSSSARPGESGNIVIYGHNKNNLFGPIRWIEKGAIINIIDNNNNQHDYEVINTKVVSPKEINYVLPKTTETLTLYTCIGFADFQRFVVIAKPL